MTELNGKALAAASRVLNERISISQRGTGRWAGATEEIIRAYLDALPPERNEPAPTRETRRALDLYDPPEGTSTDLNSIPSGYSLDLTERVPDGTAVPAEITWNGYRYMPVEVTPNTKDLDPTDFRPPEIVPGQIGVGITSRERQAFLVLMGELVGHIGRNGGYIQANLREALDTMESET